MGIIKRAVEQAMLHKPRLVDMPWIVGVQLVAVFVDLNQAGCGDFAKMHAIWIDQKCAILAGHFQCDMVEDHLVPTHHRKNAVTRCQFLPRSPFSFAIFAIRPQLSRHGISPHHYIKLQYEMKIAAGQVGNSLAVNEAKLPLLP